MELVDQLVGAVMLIGIVVVGSIATLILSLYLLTFML